MNKNLLAKTVLIIAVLIAFLFGIFGIPSSLSGKGLLAALQSRIHLGLDLKGGTHLILQVQVNDAINADSDRAIERLKDALKSANIAYAEISKPDPQNHPELIQIKGVPPESSSELRRIVSEKLPDYDLTSGVENSWTLAMKPSVANDTRKKAVQQAIETIRNRIDQLGVSEPVIQEHGLGDYQILVQLPGVDDPARVKEIMQSTAMLEIRQAVGGPYPSEQAAMQANGGVLPPDTVLMKGSAIHPQEGQENSEVYWLISRSSAVSGNDLRTADAGHDENGRADVNFSLTGDGGRRFAAFTGSHVGDKLAVVLDNRVKSVATIQEQIHDQGRITGSFSPQETQDLALTLRSGRAAGGNQVSAGSDGGAVAGRGFHSPGRAGGDHRHGRGDGLHALLLPRCGHQRGSGAVSEPGHPTGFPGLHGRNAYLAGNSRCHSDGRHGRGFQRPDLRAHSRGVAARQNAAVGGGPGLRARLDARFLIPT